MREKVVWIIALPIVLAACVWRVRFVSSGRSGYLQRAQFDAQHDCQVVELVIDNDRASSRTEADGHHHDHQAGHHHDHEAGPRRATAGPLRTTATATSGTFGGAVQ